MAVDKREGGGEKGIRREGRRNGGKEKERERVFNSIIKYTLLLKKDNIQQLDIISCDYLIIKI